MGRATESGNGMPEADIYLNGRVMAWKMKKGVGRGIKVLKIYQSVHIKRKRSEGHCRTQSIKVPSRHLRLPLSPATSTRVCPTLNIMKTHYGMQMRIFRMLPGRVYKKRHIFGRLTEEKKKEKQKKKVNEETGVG